MFNFMKKHEKKYSEKEVRKCVSVLKCCKDGRTSERFKNELLFMCSKIITRNVQGFFVAIRSIDEHNVIHTQDDIISECVIVLDKCIEKFDLSKIEYKFYFYLNSSIQKSLWRLREKEYSSESSKHIHIDINDVVNFQNDLQTTSPNPLLLDINFTKKEILLIQSKINGEKIEDFIKKLDITKVEYYKLLKIIVSKVDVKYLQD